MSDSALPDPAPLTPAPVPPLSLSTKLAYGAGDLGTAITANILGFYLLVFFTNVAGLNVGLAGSVLLIGKIWDAINDPMVGMLSDRTRSERWGRRYPWMLWGAVPFGVTFFLQWLVPSFGTGEANQWGLFAYYVLVGVLFNSFYTVVNLPYTALTPELTADYNERTSLNSFRFAFSIGGSILSLLLAGMIFRIVPEARQQYLWLGGICAVFSTLPIFWCVFGTYRRTMAMNQIHPVSAEASLPFATQLKIAFSNRPFLYVIGIYLCSWLAVQVTQAVLPFFVMDVLKLSSQIFTQIALAVQGTALLMLFIWSAVSARFGKKVVYFMGMSVWIIAQAGLFFLQPSQSGLVYPLAIMAGVGVSTAFLIPWSMIPDVIDLDELNTGQRREGVFYGFMVLLQKIGLAVGLFMVGQSLNLSGFVATVPGQPAPIQPNSALNTIRFAIGPIPTLILMLGLGLAYFYPITRDVHASILLKLQEQRR
ncbi:MAG: MFS transporter [Pegethrix bostrychoides GSE-TBD4-15B]|jgi:GPH family glycoside/pentoside/hexuronide:cation symporter|uniref:MFS transporter n=1 Tax=Pegethrix bostrychoides GSE-TBD4-15B TaxID=2839662 RepID=A0A951PDF6_9CYAN|nr:MFS transporter [Pegethrix bostrychoides GSE-TBD4-15B]